MNTHARRRSLMVAAAIAAALTGTLTTAHARASAQPATTKPAGYYIATATYTAPSAVQTAGSVTCPNTKYNIRRPTDGGVVIDSSSVYTTLGGSIDTGQGWEVFVNNDTGSSFTFTVYAVCALAKSGYTIVGSTAQDNPATSQNGYTEPCPRGTKVLGGGALNNNSSFGVSLNDEYPVGNAWHADIDNATPDDSNFYVYAVCSRYPSQYNYQVVNGSSVDNPPGAQTFAEAICPSSTYPLGGGLYSSSASTQTTINSTYPGGQTWIDYENNADTADHSIIPYAICAS